MPRTSIPLTGQSLTVEQLASELQQLKTDFLYHNHNDTVPTVKGEVRRSSQHGVYDLSDSGLRRVTIGYLAIPFLYGEALGNRDSVYYAATDGKVYKSDASFNDERIHSFLGFTIKAGNSGEVGLIAVMGRLDGFSSLTKGGNYFLSDTAGDIAYNYGTYFKHVAFALSDTELYIFPKFAVSEEGRLSTIDSDTSEISTVQTTYELADTFTINSSLTKGRLVRVTQISFQYKLKQNPALTAYAYARWRLNSGSWTTLAEQTTNATTYQDVNYTGLDIQMNNLTDTITIEFYYKISSSGGDNENTKMQNRYAYGDYYLRF